VSLFAALWRSARRPAVARRCFAIALAVGTILSLVNQWDAIHEPHVGGVVWLRILANYLVPFVVSNLGAMPLRTE
jgi:membrane-associated PAP2 superfamily phosphatase